MEKKTSERIVIIVQRICEKDVNQSQNVGMEEWINERIVGIVKRI